MRKRRVGPLRRDRDIQIKGFFYALQSLRQLVAVFAIGLNQAPSNVSGDLQRFFDCATLGHQAGEFIRCCEVLPVIDLLNMYAK